MLEGIMNMAANGELPAGSKLYCSALDMSVEVTKYSFLNEALFAEKTDGSGTVQITRKNEHYFTVFRTGHDIGSLKGARFACENGRIYANGRCVARVSRNSDFRIREVLATRADSAMFLVDATGEDTEHIGVVQKCTDDRRGYWTLKECGNVRVFCLEDDLVIVQDDKSSGDRDNEITLFLWKQDGSFEKIRTDAKIGRFGRFFYTNGLLIGQEAKRLDSEEDSLLSIWEVYENGTTGGSKPITFRRELVCSQARRTLNSFIIYSEEYEDVMLVGSFYDEAVFEIPACDRAYDRIARFLIYRDALHLTLMDAECNIIDKEYPLDKIKRVR